VLSYIIQCRLQIHYGIARYQMGFKVQYKEALYSNMRDLSQPSCAHQSTMQPQGIIPSLALPLQRLILALLVSIKKVTVI